MKKWLAALLILCLGGGCILSASAWHRANQQAGEWKARAENAECRAVQAETALAASEERRRLLALEDDPIAVFFDHLPYSGATAGYLAALEAEAYRTELENAAKLLGNDGGVPADAFLSFIHTQARAEAEAWTASLEAQGVSTAGAWSHVNQCQIPIYRFGTYTLISTCRRSGKAYVFLFNPEETRQALLDAGFQEADLPAVGQTNK